MESTDYDNIESREELGPDSVSCNALTIFTIYDTIKEFSYLFIRLKPTKLNTLRQGKGIMQHRTDVIPDSQGPPRYASTL